MNLWRVRCTLPDRPGALAALARECGAARVNILGLQIFPGVETVTDELVLHVPEDWGLVDIAGLVESAGGTSVSGTPCTEHALVDQPVRYVLAARTVLAQPASFPEVVAGLFDAEADPVEGVLGPVQDVMEMTVGDVAVQVRRTAALHAHRARPRHRDGRPGQRRPRPQPRRVRAPAPAARAPGRQQLRADVRRLRRAGGRARRGHRGRGGPAGRTRASRTGSSPSRWTSTRPGGAAGSAPGCWWRRPASPPARGSTRSSSSTEADNQAVLPIVLAAGLRGRIRMASDQLTVRIPVRDLKPLPA